MGLFDRLKKKKDDPSVQVEERRQNVLRDTAAAAAFAEAGEHEAAGSMLNQAGKSRKILVVGSEDRFSSDLIDYAIDMAKRLEFELVALNVTDAPFALPKEKRDEAAGVFKESCRKNIATFQKKAEENGIAFSHLIEFGEQDDVIEKMHARSPGMRFVLTEPDPEVTRKAKGKVAIPVVDMGNYQGAAA